jgi:C-5 cytosine-specific DNA methylase
MGIPDDVAVYGPQIAQYRQIGNAVCPPVADALATEIRNKVALSRGGGSKRRAWAEPRAVQVRT